VSPEYGDPWPRVVEARFRTAQEPAAVLAMCAAFCGQEPARVKLGVLKAADRSIEKVRWLLALAENDCRGLLCEAEYPLSSRKWGLKDKGPEKYEALLAKEQDKDEPRLESGGGNLTRARLNADVRRRVSHQKPHRTHACSGQMLTGTQRATVGAQES
jgi:hypothetical protein